MEDKSQWWMESSVSVSPV